MEATSTAAATSTPNPAPTSPARSDKSSDSEGKAVREKLQETGIDAQATSDPVPSSDQHMDDVPNGSAKPGEQSASGSDTDRGRLRKKRSREDFEEGNEEDKHSEKKHEKEERHHVRKRSRDVKDIESGAPLKPQAKPVATIEEGDVDEPMTSPSKDKKDTAATTSTGTDASPKNKRTREQVEEGSTLDDEAAKDGVTNGKPASKTEEERTSKRPRDEDGTQPTAKPQAPKASDRPEETSDDKFKKSGFATAPSAFGGLAGKDSKPPFGFGNTSTQSPFAAKGVDNKLSSFAAKPASPKPSTGVLGLGDTSTSTGGFGGLKGTSNSTGFSGLGASTTSPLGGTTFGSSSTGFASLSKAPLSSFGSATPSDLTIKGLKSKPTAFGTPGEDKDDVSDEEDGDDEDGEKDTTEKEKLPSQPLLSQQRTSHHITYNLTKVSLLTQTAHETGEEGETTLWTGRAKLYTMAGSGTTRAWKERGTGTFKLNITVDEPKKARFVLRADGTHRLILNAAVTKQMVFGGDAAGEKPKDTRLLFNAPNGGGELEMHLLKVCHDVPRYGGVENLPRRCKCRQSANS